jgi:hypothetical protein
MINTGTAVASSGGQNEIYISMKEGKITIIAYSTAATSNIRWETIGFTITKVPIKSTAYIKGKMGPGSVSDAYGSGYATLWFSNAVSKTSVDMGSTNMTTFVFGEDQVENALGENFDDVETNTYVYLHMIFRTYDYSSGATRKNNLKNWSDIMNAESWGSNTLDDFAKYYNIEMIYEPTAKNFMYYETESGATIKEKKQLNGGTIGSRSITWNNEPTRIHKNDIEYELSGYYVCRRNDAQKTKLEDYYVDDGWDLDYIRSSNALVYTGGTEVHMVYRVKTGDEDITPTPTPSPTPIPVPGDGGGGTPTPSPSPIMVPESETITGNMSTPIAIGAIRADNRGNEKFVVTAGIPTTESLYTQVEASKYLLGYSFKKQVGIETYPVKVTKDYVLVWEGENEKSIEDEEEMIELSETVRVTQVVNIQRAYGYWEILNFDLYKISNALISNYALPGGSTTMTPNYGAGYNPPNVATMHSHNKDDHIIKPNEIINGIVLPTVTITGAIEKPTVPNEDFTIVVDEMIPELKVKNDSLILNGTTIMNSNPSEKEGAPVNSSFLETLRQEGTIKCNENVIYKPNQIIEATKKNGTYHSSGTITYSRINSVNSKFNSNIQANIQNLSSVIIHTPVYCEAVVTANNDTYVQLINPTSALQLVLDPDPSLNDFTLNISNYGLHSNKQGYYTRDFSRALRDTNVSYLALTNNILRNEVKFPFDIFIKNVSGDTFVKKNTWIVLGRNTNTFYVPMWVTEGNYTVICRSIAVNADLSKLEDVTEERANTLLFNYVAKDSFEVEISGRMYGLSIYDITDYPIWEDVFRVKNTLGLKINNQTKYPNGTDKTTYSQGYSYTYTVGTNDQYGNDSGRNVKYTFPLVNNSHPKYKNIGGLKTGYVVRFKLNTIGTMYSNNSYIRIKPTYYYVDKLGKNRISVDLYYEETINGRNRKLVKVGSDLDKTNIKTMEVGSPYVGIPTKELKNTATIMKITYSKLIHSLDDIFTFDEIKIPSTFRTFVNNAYTSLIQSCNQYSKIQDAEITTDVLMKQMQSWYGCYYIPAKVYAVPIGYDVTGYASKQGIDYKESFWKKDGYIIVNFDIVTVDSNGNEKLSYINANNYLKNNNNSMWVMEGAPLNKTDSNGGNFTFKAGDFIMYDTNKSVGQDYSPGGIY